MTKTKASDTEENKMVTIYANKGNVIIAGKFVKKGTEAKITEAEAKTLKSSRLAKMVDFK